MTLPFAVGDMVAMNNPNKDTPPGMSVVVGHVIRYEDGTFFVTFEDEIRAVTSHEAYAAIDAFPDDTRNHLVKSAEIDFQETLDQQYQEQVEALRATMGGILGSIHRTEGNGSSERDSHPNR